MYMRRVVDVKSVKKKKKKQQKIKSFFMKKNMLKSKDMLKSNHAILKNYTKIKQLHVLVNIIRNDIVKNNPRNSQEKLIWF